jgi:hypothetical protein
VDNNEEFETGYGRPPKRTRFQPGVSGNSNGRPKGSKNLATIFWKITHEKVQVKGPRGPRWISKLEVGITQLVNSAAKGDPKAIRELFHWAMAFGDVSPMAKAPIFQVNFVKSAYEKALEKTGEKDHEI